MRLAIGFDDPFAPFAFVESGRPRGLAIEILERALATAGVAYTLLPLPLEGIEAALREGRIDAIAFKAITVERRTWMTFSAPLVETGAALFPRAGDRRFALAEYAGRSIATPRAGPLAAAIAREHPQVRLALVESYDASIEAVLHGRADAAALNLHAGTALVRARAAGRFELPPSPYLRIPLAFAARSGAHVGLVERISRALRALHDCGEVAAIEQRWLLR